MLLNSQVSSKTKLSRREVKAFFDKLETTRAHNDTESKVEEAVNNILETYLKRIYGEKNVTALKAKQTDGVITVQNGLMGSFSIIVEAKRDFELGTKASDRAKILAQAISYVKRAQQRGENLPTALVLADYDEIFTVPLRLVQRYLDGNYDWSLAPSSAWQDAKLFDSLVDDPNFNSIYVEYTHRDTFDIEHFCNRVHAYATDRKDLQKIAVDKHSLEKAFVEFQRTVFGAQTAAETEKVELFGKKKSITYAQVQIFIKSLLGDRNIYIDPIDRRTVVIVYKDHKGQERLFRYPPSSRFLFSAEAYEQFFTKYDRGQGAYDLASKKEITEIADTLFDEFDRRFTGDYWTPQIWVDEAHKMIEEQLGSDWKEKYVVWDPACGAKNLTRGYEFKELYCSTLHQEELNIAEDYNPEAVTFQYDFLNDDIEIHKFNEGLKFGDVSTNHFKIPDELIESLRSNKPIVFFANPPYGQTTNQNAENKLGISSTQTALMMTKYRHASMELYTQFIYRVQQLAKAFGYTKDFHFFFFFNKGFLTSKSFSVFTEGLCREFRFRDGFMLNAGEFKGTSSAWGIIFSGWEIEANDSPQTRFKFKVKASTSSNEIATVTSWEGRSAPDRTISSMVKSSKDYIQKYPTTKNGFERSTGKGKSGRMTSSAIGYLHSNSDNVQYSDKYTGFYSLCFHSGHGHIIERDNFEQASQVFAIRKTALPALFERDLLWVRDKDVFPAVSASLGQDPVFTSDCVVYSLFDKSSNQTSLRNYEYDSEKWSIKNEFFWLPQNWIRTWAEADRQYDLRDDADLFSGDRYVSTWLTDHWTDTSPEAQDLLKISNTILKSSLRYRKSYDNLHPKYNLLTWDAGWLQIYKMCFSRDALPAAKNDEKLQAQYEKFKITRRALGDKIATEYSNDTGF